ncbi:MAG: Gfo/Idh/MocA family oxidoreductase [Planctomycetota bacterium]|nr:Gfo/Idh/MocA family oxidoreductase [Planctomycetota bacterium]
MREPLKLAVIGPGRIGRFHALHAQELAREGAGCELTAVVDLRRDVAERVAEELEAHQDGKIAVFSDVEELAATGVADASVICSPTAHHREHAETVIRAGQRVLLEKPLTGSLDGDREFTAFLGEHHPRALMLAFQRRFDDALLHAKGMLERGAIGRPFKFVSVLEDSRPPPDGYNSPGLLGDMSVHNVDEVLWLSGVLPVRVAALGSRLFNCRIASVEEDYDDALLQMWFDGDLMARVEVSRNHVSGYRTETWIFGEDGSIHVGRFEQNRHEIVVEAYGSERPIERRTFPLREYRSSVAGTSVPEFVDRFGPAYRAELADFVHRCRKEEPFSVNQDDGLRAMEVIEAALGSLRDRGTSVPVGRWR